MKWAYVKIKDLQVQGRFQFTLVPIPRELTVVQFRALWREDPESAVFVPSKTLPLQDHDRLHSHIDQFDTIILASSWVGNHGSVVPMTARSAFTMP